MSTLLHGMPSFGTMTKYEFFGHDKIDNGWNEMPRYVDWQYLEEIKELLGRARAKKGMFEGDLENGELEIGQIAGLIHSIKPAAEIVQEIVKEFQEIKKTFC